MKFQGFKTSNTNRTSDQPRVVGEPCIHKDHFGEDLGFRQGSTQACLKCMEKLEDPKINFNPSGLTEKAQTLRLRFWSRVEILDPIECWSFNPISSNKNMLFFWRRPKLYSNYEFHPSRVANWLTWGDLGMMGTRSRCGERNCVNPLHNHPSCISDKDIRSQDLDDVRNQLEILQEQVRIFTTPDLPSEEEFDAFNIQQNTAFEKPYREAYNQVMRQLLNV